MYYYACISYRNKDLDVLWIGERIDVEVILKNLERGSRVNVYSFSPMGIRTFICTLLNGYL